MSGFKLDSPRHVEYRRLDTLRADPRNPKAHQLDTIDESIGRFGMVESIVEDGRTGYLISGHGRTETLKRKMDAGEGAPEGISVDSDGMWLAPVLVGWSSRSDTEAAAALIALNRTTELGGWVDEALLELLDDLKDVDEGLAGVGYDETQIELLRQDINKIEDEPDKPGKAVKTDTSKDLVVLVTIAPSRRQALYEMLEAVPWIKHVDDGVAT